MTLVDAVERAHRLDESEAEAFQEYDRRTNKKMAKHNRSGGDVRKPVRKVKGASEGDKWDRAKFNSRKAAQILSRKDPLKDDKGNPTPAAMQFKRWGEKIPDTLEDVQGILSRANRQKERYRPDDAFTLGYLDVMEDRLDRKGQGKPCGKGFISARKKCSREKSQQLARDLNAGDAGAKARVSRGKQLAGDRQKLRREVERNLTEGRTKAFVKPKAVPAPEPVQPTATEAAMRGEGRLPKGAKKKDGVLVVAKGDLYDEILRSPEWQSSRYKSFDRMGDAIESVKTSEASDARYGGTGRTDRVIVGSAKSGFSVFERAKRLDPSADPVDESKRKKAEVDGLNTSAAEYDSKKQRIRDEEKTIRNAHRLEDVPKRGSTVTAYDYDGDKFKRFTVKGYSSKTEKLKLEDEKGRSTSAYIGQVLDGNADAKRLTELTRESTRLTDESRNWRGSDASVAARTAENRFESDLDTQTQEILSATYGRDGFNGENAAIAAMLTTSTGDPKAAANYIRTVLNRAYSPRNQDSSNFSPEAFRRVQRVADQLDQWSDNPPARVRELWDINKMNRSDSFWQGYLDVMRADAEPESPPEDDKELVQMIVSALEDGYTSGIEALLSYGMAGDTIYGRFRDEGKTFGYTLTGGEIAYWQLRGQARTDSLLDEPVYRADRKMMKGAKGKKCNIGTKCRYGCIQSTKTCRIEPSPSAKGFIRRAMELIKKVIGKGKSEADKEVLASAKQTAKEGKALGNQGKAEIDRNAQMEQQSGNIAQLRKMKRKDASDPWLQGYLDVMENRFDQRGQGVPCGQSWIPRSKKCSKEKAKTTSKEARKRGAEKARDRASLKKEIKTAGRVRDLKKSVAERYQKLQSGEIPVEQRARIRSEQGKEVGQLNYLVMEQGIARGKRKAAKERGRKVDLPTATVVAMSKPRASLFGDDPTVGVKFRFEDGREKWKNFSARDADFQKLKRGQSYSVSLNRGSGRISNVFDPVEAPKPKPKPKPVKKAKSGSEGGDRTPDVAQTFERMKGFAGDTLNRDVLGLTAQGLTPKQIASNLQVGQGTVISRIAAANEILGNGQDPSGRKLAEAMKEFRQRRLKEIETAPLNTKPRPTTFVGAVSIDSAQSEAFNRGYHDVMSGETA